MSNFRIFFNHDDDGQNVVKSSQSGAFQKAKFQIFFDHGESISQNDISQAILEYLKDKISKLFFDHGESITQDRRKSGYLEAFER